MAAFQGMAKVAEEALAAATAETIIQLIAPSNHRVKLLAWGIYFDGTSVTAEPVQVTLTRQTTAGTGSALSLVKRDDSIAETLQTTAQQDFSAEPTSGDELEAREVHPQAGFEVWYPLGQEIIIGGGDRLGLIATAPAIVNCRAWMLFEE